MFGNVSYAFLTMIGVVFGHALRCEHSLKSLDQDTIFAWPFVSVGGLVFTNITPVFYLMTMVTVGWVVCDYTLHAFHLRT